MTGSYGCQNVVLTLGEKGVVFQGGQEAEPIHVPTQVVKAVDTTVRIFVIISKTTIRIIVLSVTICSLHVENDSISIYEFYQ